MIYDNIIFMLLLRYCAGLYIVTFMERVVVAFGLEGFLSLHARPLSIDGSTLR